MAVEMRELNKIKEKVVIRLDNRQIGWLVFFALACFGIVFAAGFFVGSGSNRPPAEQAPIVAAAPADKQTQAETGAEAGQDPASALADSATAAHYTYDRVLTAPTPPVQSDDPALKLLAASRGQDLRPAGGDMDLAGPRPLDEVPGDAATHPAAVHVDEAQPGADKEAGAAGNGGPGQDAPAPLEGDGESEFEKALDSGGNPPPAPEDAAVTVSLRPAQAAAPARLAPGEAAAAEGPGAQPGDSAAAPPAPPQPTGYTIQVKAFQHRPEAEKFISVLRGAGYQPYLLAADLPGKGRFYRVRLGKFQTMEEATQRQEAFEAAESFKTIVTPL